jgi:hypothetical protein
MYAFTVKNDQSTWDIWYTLSDIPIPERKAIVEAAFASGLPITGQNLTNHGLSVKSGAVWNGTAWTGGEPHNRTEESVVNLFSYICDNTIILTQLSSPNTDSDDQIAAIFESENSMIKVPEGQTAKKGDIWDGEKVVSLV